jgi:transposase-like protein
VNRGGEPAKIALGLLKLTVPCRLRRRQPRPGDKWHLDEVFLTINGRRQYLWRALDQDGNVLDILVSCRRDAKAAKRFFRCVQTVGG